jgi:hypothetical protein
VIRPEQLVTMVQTVEDTWDREAVVLTLTLASDDDYGNAPESYVPAGAPVLCGLVHRAGREVTQDRDTQITDWTGRFPPPTVLSGRDRIRISDPSPEPGWEAEPTGWALYEVVGPPERLGTHVHAELLHVAGG